MVKKININFMAMQIIKYEKKGDVDCVTNRFI